MNDAEVLGIKNGWRGLVEGDVEPLTRAAVTGILPRGGTILGTSRLNPVTDPEVLDRLKQNWQRFGLHALIVVGGEGSLSAALDLWRDHRLPLVSFGIFYPGGRLLESSKNAGITELMLRTAIRGTKRFNSEDIARRLENAGARIQVVSEPDFFGFIVDGLIRDVWMHSAS